MRNKLAQSFTVIISLMMLSILLFSAFFIVAEVNHQCTADNCTICAMMEAAEGMLKGMGTSTLWSATAGLPLLFLSLPILFSFSTVGRSNLFFLRVRLNN